MLLRCHFIPEQIFVKAMMALECSQQDSLEFPLVAIRCPSTAVAFQVADLICSTGAFNPFGAAVRERDDAILSRTERLRALRRSKRFESRRSEKYIAFGYAYGSA
jgi:hypothetical protein